MPRRSRDERRQEILAVMLEMTESLGPDKVTTRALAARIGVTEPALYRYFSGGKAAMWDALAEHIGERLAAVWRDAAAIACPVDRLRALARLQLQAIADTPALPSILLSRSLHRDNPALKAGMVRQLTRYYRLVRECVDEGQRRGALAGTDSRTAAWLVIAVIQGTALRWSLTDGGFDLVDEGMAVLETSLAGLLPSRPDTAEGSE